MSTWLIFYFSIYTIIRARPAKKEVKAQVIRADGLAEYIRKTNALPQSPAISEKQMQEMAQYFLSLDRPQTVDRLEKYRTALARQQEGLAPAPAVPVPPQKPAHKKAEPRPKPSSKPTPDPASSPSPNPAPAQKETALPTSEIGAAAEPVVLCPKCGAPMVKRVAAKGPNAGKTFYGCSRFPHCRGIVNLKTE